MCRTTVLITCKLGIWIGGPQFVNNSEKWVILATTIITEWYYEILDWSFRKRESNCSHNSDAYTETQIDSIRKKGLMHLIWVMEGSDHSLVPQWLKGSGNDSRVAGINNQFTSSPYSGNYLCLVLNTWLLITCSFVLKIKEGKVRKKKLRSHFSFLSFS